MKPYFIGIAGPSCAGKSFLAHNVAQELDAALLNLDSYYRELSHLSLAQRANYNFDSPEALDSELLIRHAISLAEGASVDMPVYDFATHSRKAETNTLEPHPFIIVEGLFALYWQELRELQGTRVYVDLDERICLKRRCDRDVRERGRTRESVVEQYRATVGPMARQYVYPTRMHADIVLTGNQDIRLEAAAVLEHVRAGAIESR